MDHTPDTPDTPADDTAVFTVPADDTMMTITRILDDSPRPAMPPQIASAWVAAWGELVDPIKDSTAKVDTRSGSNYTYDYTTLDKVLGPARQVLSRHGLALSQPVWRDDSGLYIRTMLIHCSGHVHDSGVYRLAPHGTPQDHGSAITYARRYQALALLALAPADDDDGRSATEATKRNQGRTVTGSAQHKAEPPADPGPPYSRPDLEGIVGSITVAETTEELRQCWAAANKGGMLHAPIQDLAPQNVRTAHPTLTVTEYMILRNAEIRGDRVDEPDEQADQTQQTEPVDEPTLLPDADDEPKPQTASLTYESVQAMDTRRLKKAYRDAQVDWHDGVDLGEARNWLCQVLGLMDN